MLFYDRLICLSSIFLFENLKKSDCTLAKKWIFREPPWRGFSLKTAILQLYEPVLLLRASNLFRWSYIVLAHNKTPQNHTSSKCFILLTTQWPLFYYFLPFFRTITFILCFDVVIIFGEKWLVTSITWAICVRENINSNNWRSLGPIQMRFSAKIFF